MSNINGPTIEELKHENDLLFEAFSEESDRGVALVAASFFDATLERLLRSRFSSRPDKHVRFVEPLFEALAPLSTFSAKIRLCYAIDLMNESMARDLDSIRQIRNKFAHTLQPKAFGDRDIASIVDQLVAYTKTNNGLRTIPPEKLSRVKFDLTCSRIGALLQAKVVVQQSEMPVEMKQSFMLSNDL